MKKVQEKSCLFLSILNYSFVVSDKSRFPNKSIMGATKRKSRKKPPPKVKVIVPLDTQFDCPFCHHDKSCDVKMDRARNTARITCMVCTECFQTKIHYLSEPIDVYNDWIDACESVN